MPFLCVAPHAPLDERVVTCIRVAIRVIVCGVATKKEANGFTQCAPVALHSLPLKASNIQRRFCRRCCSWRSVLHKTTFGRSGFLHVQILCKQNAKMDCKRFMAKENCKADSLASWLWYRSEGNGITFRSGKIFIHKTVHCVFYPNKSERRKTTYILDLNVHRAVLLLCLQFLLIQVLMELLNGQGWL